jgi:glycosyltransferase involved in cell wall biosynthesis
MARILHVIPYMHPWAGGPPVAVENFVREASKRGYLSEIISTSLFCDDNGSCLLKRLNALAPTTFLSDCGPFVLLNSTAKRQIAEGIRTADIVHVHTLWNPINTLVRRECARQRRPYVLMPHGMLDPYSLSVKRWRKALYLWAIERKNISSAQRLIYTTPEEARLATTKNSISKGVVISLGADAPSGSENLASGFVARFPKARGRRQLLFLGRLDFKKGLDRILRSLPSVVKAFPDVLLTIVGDGSLKFKETLTRTITSQALEKNVLLTGRLDGALKWGAYASAELFLLPSRQENFAITVAEAMQMGVPVIISNKVNTWPYVKDAGAGLVLDENEIEIQLETGLLSLLAAPAQIELMGRSARDYAWKNLTWPQATSCLLKCYDDVLSSFDRHWHRRERS